MATITWGKDVAEVYDVTSAAMFDPAVLDPASGQLKPEFVHNTTTGGEGDRLHPNRLGYIAMGRAIDLSLFK